jgi:hypothetical protein
MDRVLIDVHPIVIVEVHYELRDVGRRDLHLPVHRMLPLARRDNVEAIRNFSKGRSLLEELDRKRDSLFAIVITLLHAPIIQHGRPLAVGRWKKSREVMSDEDGQSTRGDELRRFYAEVGEIVVRAEWVCRAMNDTLWSLLVLKGGLDEDYAKIVLAGYNVENMRRYWTALVKASFEENDADAHKMVDSISDRIASVMEKRNDIVHRVWYTDFPGKQMYERLEGVKITRSFKRKSPGGINYSVRKAKDFDEVLKELQRVNVLINIMMLAVLNGYPPSRNLQFDKANRLVPQASIDE